MMGPSTALQKAGKRGQHARNVARDFKRTSSKFNLDQVPLAYLLINFVLEFKHNYIVTHVYIYIYNYSVSRFPFSTHQFSPKQLIHEVPTQMVDVPIQKERGQNGIEARPGN